MVQLKIFSKNRENDMNKVEFLCSFHEKFSAWKIEFLCLFHENSLLGKSTGLYLENKMKGMIETNPVVEKTPGWDAERVM